MPIIALAMALFSFFAFSEDVYGQEFYKWVDEKGTVHFSDNPASTVSNQEKERPKENGIELLKRLERDNRSQATTSGGKRIIINYSQSSSGGSSGGGPTTTIRSGRS